MLRREFIKLGLIAALPLEGCRTLEEFEVTGRSIDAHCHVFNASDLPVVRFIKQTFLRRYPEQYEKRILDVEDPDLLDFLLELVTRLLGTGAAPTADDEVKVLLGAREPSPAGVDYDLAKARAVDGTARFIRELESRARGPVTMGVAETSPEARQLNAFLRAVDEGGPRVEAITPLQSKRIATKAFSRLDQIGAYLRWIPLFTLYRYKLVDRLAADHKRQGREPLLLAPAMVDFEHWLGESVNRSPLPDQVKVMGLLAKRAEGPPVHGYFGFDPLREIYFRVGKDPVSPLQLARTALEEHGFLGVKLYPPMGFRASGNKPPYPQRVRTQLGFDPSKKLDEALDQLYKLCDDLGAPILAHGHASNGAGPNYDARADPAFWLPVFGTYPKLHVCLAHFGRFRVVSEGAPGTELPANSWEWRLGAYMRENPNAPIYADLSFFSEVLHADRVERAKLASDFSAWIREFDPDVKHLLFGTDWLMLGMDPEYDRYIPTIDAFLRHDCHWSDDMINRVFVTNALRFFGLQAGEKTHGRLVAFYERSKLDAARLPSIGGNFVASLFGR
ncbi:amidohydrolase family protein [Mesorhizobium muleiense]|uniref:amidohydrolase family protein n=1 Tax=Mesorhizobium muleiense TaxID=1004279 RepID=UPI003AFB6E1C